MTKVQNLIAVLAGPAQDIENALQQLLLNRAVDTAEGVQLDQLGVLVGQPRGGLSDDDYRRYLRARIATNRSGGVTEDLIRVASLIVNNVSAVYHVERSGVATVVVRVAGVAVTPATGHTLFTFLDQAASAGVRLMVLWSESVPASTFTLDSGPGLDVGHLATSEG